jgi:hypothetical protein
VTPDLLRQAGEALYGSRWPAPLARDLNVNRDSVQDWLQGRYAIRPGVMADISILIDARSNALAEVAGRLACYRSRGASLWRSNEGEP